MLHKLAAPETDEIKAKCRAIIDRFAHREALREDDIRAWISNVVGEHGEMGIWHATRAGGFGGSDIGVLVRNFQGHRADFQASAHDIVAGKLLRSVPSEETGDLRRGHENEPGHALRYYAKYGAVRDQAAYDGLTKAAALRFWMRYSPDDVVLVPAERPNPRVSGQAVRRLLVDYKAPRQVDDAPSIAFQYSCQLHQGAMLCAANTIHLDGLQLSQFDWAKWSLKDDFVAYDPELARLILAAGDHYAGFMLRGELPPYIFTPKFEKQEEFAVRFGKKAQVLAQVSAISKALKDEVDFRANELKQELVDVRLAGTRISIGDLTVSAVQLVDHKKVAQLVNAAEAVALRKAGPGTDVSWDVEAMAARLRQYGDDPAAFRTDKFDADKVYDFLVAKGLDPEQFMAEQIRLVPSKFLKEQAVDLVARTYPRNDVSHEVQQQDPPANDAAAMNVRDGQSTERFAQRTVMA